MQTQLGELAMFTLSQVPPASYTLTLDMGQVVVELPLLELGKGDANLIRSCADRKMGDDSLWVDGLAVAVVLY
jgi:hypothetical protein